MKCVFLAFALLHPTLTSSVPVPALTNNSSRPNEKLSPIPFPVVILKLPRDGSSFLGDSLRNSEAFCSFNNEIGGRVRHELQASSPHLSQLNVSLCQEFLEEADNTLSCGIGDKNSMARASPSSPSYGGFTVNPFNFAFDSSTRKPAECWKELTRRLRRLNTTMVVLTRENVVAQAVSSKITEEIARRGLCGGHTVWHLEKCPPEFQPGIAGLKLTLDPAEVVVASDSFKKKSEDLVAVAHRMSSNPVLHITFEEMLRSGGGSSLALPERLKRFIQDPFGFHGDLTPSSAGDAELSSGAAHFTEKLTNVDEITEYMKVHSPHLVRFISARP